MDGILKIKQKTIVHQIMEAMKQFIISGKIKPGDKLPTEFELAQKFGVGRSSVREAIKVFKYIGVLDSHTKNGTILNYHSSISEEAITWAFLLSKRDMQDILDVRKMIEQEGWIRLSNSYQNGEEESKIILSKLETEVSNLKISIEKGNMKDLSEADFKFHEIVVEFTDNKPLIALFQTLKSFTFEEIVQSHVYQERTNNITRIISSHKKLCNSIKEQDTVKTLILFRDHIEDTKEMLLKLRDMV